MWWNYNQNNKIKNDLKKQKQNKSQQLNISCQGKVTCLSMSLSLLRSYIFIPAWVDSMYNSAVIMHSRDKMTERAHQRNWNGEGSLKYFRWAALQVGTGSPGVVRRIPQSKHAATYMSCADLTARPRTRTWPCLMAHFMWCRGGLFMSHLSF